MGDNIGVGEFLHDFYFLVNVFLEEWLLLDEEFIDDFDGIEMIIFPYITKVVLCLTKITSPNAPFPIDFIDS